MLFQNKYRRKIQELEREVNHLNIKLSEEYAIEVSLHKNAQELTKKNVELRKENLELLERLHNVLKEATKE